MFKILFKKQLMEINQAYFINRKTGKGRSAKSIAGLAALSIFIVLVCAVSFFWMCEGFGQFFSTVDLLTVIPCILALFSLIVGIIGTEATAYAAFYRASDTPLLLSLPIPHKDIIAARLVGVAVASFAFVGIVWLPFLVWWWARGPVYGVDVSAAVVLCGIAVWLVLTILSVVLALALGWVIAQISGRVKNKSIVATVATIVLLLLYFYFYFSFQNMFASDPAAAIAFFEGMSAWGAPIVCLGNAAIGSGGSLALCALVAVALGAIMWVILLRTFVSIAMRKTSAPRKEKYDAAKVRAGNAKKALAMRERKRFTGSSTYMINCSLGLVFLVIFAVCLIYLGAVNYEAIAALNEAIPEIMKFAPVVLTAIVMLVSSMTPATAASVSLEGKTLWQIRCLPVSTADVLQAKMNLQIRLSALPGAVCAALAGIVFGCGWELTILMTAIAACWAFLEAEVGLALNLHWPNLTWTNEVVPIKQGMPVALSLFGGWFVGILFAGIYVLLALFAGVEALPYMTIAFVVLVVIVSLIRRWIFTRGVELFEAL